MTNPKDPDGKMNLDPITDEPGAHPVGTGLGAAGGAGHQGAHHLQRPRRPALHRPGRGASRAAAEQGQGRARDAQAHGAPGRRRRTVLRDTALMRVRTLRRRAP